MLIEHRFGRPAKNSSLEEINEMNSKLIDEERQKPIWSNCHKNETCPLGHRDKCIQNDCNKMGRVYNGIWADCGNWFFKGQCSLPRWEQNNEKCTLKGDRVKYGRLMGIPDWKSDKLGVCNDRKNFQLLYNAKQNKCLDATDSDQAVFKQCDAKNPYQLWSNVDGTLRNLRRNVCLDAGGAGENVVYNSKNCDANNNWQKWRREGLLFRREGTNDCLYAGDANKIDVKGCNRDNNYQKLEQKQLLQCIDKGLSGIWGEYTFDNDCLKKTTSEYKDESCIDIDKLKVSKIVHPLKGVDWEKACEYVGENLEGKQYFKRCERGGDGAMYAIYEKPADKCKPYGENVSETCIGVGKKRVNKIIRNPIGDWMKSCEYVGQSHPNFKKCERQWDNSIHAIYEVVDKNKCSPKWGNFASECKEKGKRKYFSRLDLGKHYEDPTHWMSTCKEMPTTEDVNNDGKLDKLQCVDRAPDGIWAEVTLDDDTCKGGGFFENIFNFEDVKSKLIFTVFVILIFVIYGISIYLSSIFLPSKTTILIGSVGFIIVIIAIIIAYFLIIRRNNFISLRI